MAEEFQGSVCGGNWWNPSRSVFGLSQCSSVMNDIGSYGWPNEILEMKAKSSDESSDGSMLFQDIERTSCGTTTMPADSSTLQMMGIGLSSSTATDWNQSLPHGNGRTESNYNPMLQDGLANFSPEESSINVIKAGNQLGFSTDQQPLNFITSSSSSYAYPSSLMQTLFDTNSPPQQSPYENGSMTYSSATNGYHANLSEFPGSLTKLSSSVKPKQHVSGGLHLCNKTPFWNASGSAHNDLRAGFYPSTQPQFLSSAYEQKPNCPTVTTKSTNEESRDSKKSSNEPFKRPRLETPSPLPTFKVRKEKLGDRITALQQLVSPFGKTDTASVLHEAIEYIKLLHDQVNVLSTPYMKNGAVIQRQQVCDNLKDTEEAKQDLKSRGLCLVPVSSTFPVAAEPTDLWTPSFGSSFR